MKETVKLLISESDINKRINEIAGLISNEYKGGSITLICVLKGGVVFMTDIAKRIKDVSVEFDFIDISSYGNGTTSGMIRINKDLENTIEGKDVILIEDIIDTGRTLSLLVNHLKSQSPKSLKVCTLLDKPDRRLVFDVIPEYVGFVIPDEFVVGFGLDYAQKYRNLPFIGVMHFSEE